VNVPTHKDGWSALYWAASKGQLEVCRLLINSNANINIQTSGGDTPLHVAISEGKVDVVALLLSRGADTQIKFDGKTALEFAQEKGNSEMIKLLQSTQSVTNVKEVTHTKQESPKQVITPKQEVPQVSKQETPKPQVTVQN
jgi:ankyrin repeat protein